MTHEPNKAARVDPAAGNCWGMFVCFLVVFLSTKKMPLCFELTRSKYIYSAGDPWGERPVDVHGTLRTKDEPWCFLGHWVWCGTLWLFFSSLWLWELNLGPAHVENSILLFVTPLALNKFRTMLILKELAEFEFFIHFCSCYYWRMRSVWSFMSVPNMDLIFSVAL